MDDEDERFKEIVNDPRFRTLRRNERKVKIDERFKSMFNEKRFKFKYSVDKRGRKVKFSNTDHLKKVYEVSDREDEDDHLIMQGKKCNEDINSSESEDHDQECIPVKQSKSFSNKFTDLRGENNADESSSSDEESSEEEEKKEEVDHKWGELDKDAPRSDSISSRLAVCNIDWDRIKASDLFILFSTFNTEIGTIKSVKIYLSKFGKERMKEEEFNGPKELVQVTLKDDEKDPFAKSNDQDHEVINSDNSFISEKLREYQIKRLKYYYAVVECNNEETALHLYKELDGLEYESSASTLDIRFIPDDVAFDDEVPSSECISMPLLADYEPPTFVTTALQQSKVKLTWDETDPERNIKLRKAFKNTDKASDDLRAYLASDNEDDEQNEADNIIEQTNMDNDEDDDHRLSKYKALLKSLDVAKEKEKPKFELEVTWEPNLEQTHDQDSEEERTLFEKEKAKKRKAKKMRKDDLKELEEDDECNKDDLNLLTLDDEENKKHFDYNDFIDDKSKRRRKKKKATINEQDHFIFDPEDPRFSAIYSSHFYNIEQSNPHFKKTKAIQDLLHHKIKKSRINN